MNNILHILFMVAIGIMLSASAHIYWQSARQLMIAPGSIALLSGYALMYLLNSNMSPEVAVIIALSVGPLLTFALNCISRPINRSEFMLLGLALIELVRNSAYILDPITGGADGKSLSYDAISLSANIPIITVSLSILLIMALSNAWRHTYGITMRFVGMSPQGASLIGIDVKRVELISTTVAGLFAAMAGVCYVLVIRYLHPNDLNISIGLSALLVGLAVRPIHIIKDFIFISIVIFGLRDALRYIGTSTIRFGMHDLFIGIILIIVAIRIGRDHSMNEGQKEG